MLELGLNECTSYGYYKDLKPEEIRYRVDWMILSEYLEIRYDYRLPMIVFSEKGWEIERVAYADEVFRDFIKGNLDLDGNGRLSDDDKNQQKNHVNSFFLSNVCIQSALK